MQIAEVRGPEGEPGVAAVLAGYHQGNQRQKKFVEQNRHERFQIDSFSGLDRFRVKPVVSTSLAARATLNANESLQTRHAETGQLVWTCCVLYSPRPFRRGVRVVEGARLESV